MDPHYYWRYTTEENVFVNNVHKINTFPDNDLTASIKADKAGQLYWTCGKGIGKAWGYTFGKNFVETETIIEKTCKHSLKFFEEMYQDLAKESFNPSQKEQIEKLQVLAEHLSNEISLMVGVERIDNIYFLKHKEGVKPEGCEELRMLKEQFKSTVKADLERFKQLIVNSQDLQEIKEISKKLVPFQYTIGIFPKEDPASNLKAYCEKYCAGIDSEEAAAYIQKGKEIFETVMKDDQKLDNTEEVCTALTWYLVSLAIEKKQGFEEGTFVIEDPKDRLYNFLLSSPIVYQRASSHYKERSSVIQLGVDIFNGKMPAHKRTLLFEKVHNPPYEDMPEQVLFLKPENYSADIYNPKKAYDASMHLYEFAVTQYNKIYYPGSDDFPNMRKERVPAKELEEFFKQIDILARYKSDAGTLEKWLAQIFNDKNLGPLKENMSVQNIKSCAKKYGIAFMKRFVDNIEAYGKNGGEIPSESKFSTLIDMISQYDHPELRTGREVYIPDHLGT